MVDYSKTLLLVEDGAQRISSEGNLEEISINRNTDFWNNLEIGMQDLYPDFDAELPIGQRNGAVSYLEDLAEVNLLSDPQAVMQSFTNALLNGGTDSERVEWKSTNPETGQTEDLIQLMAEGSLSESDAYQRLLDERTAFAVTDTNGREYSVDFENGQVVGINDGIEDHIPDTVIEGASKFAARTGEAITVVPIVKPENTQYLFVNDEGSILELPVTVSPETGELVKVDNNDATYNVPSGAGGGIAYGDHSDAPHVDNPMALQDDLSPEKEPPQYDATYNVPSGADGGIAYGDHSDAPHVDNPMALQDDLSPEKEPQYVVSVADPSTIYAYYTEPLSLSYEPDVPLEKSDEAMLFQELALKIAELSENFSVDLGKTGENGDGVDGQYGPKSRMVAMEVEKYFGDQVPTGVVTDTLLNKMIDEVAELGRQQAMLNQQDATNDTNYGNNNVVSATILSTKM